MFRLAFLALGVSAYLAMMDPEPEEDPRLAPLLAKGWSAVDRPPCTGLGPGFYEAESETENREFLVLGEGITLSSRPPPWPDEEIHCRPIPHPSHVQEIP